VAITLIDPLAEVSCWVQPSVAGGFGDIWICWRFACRIRARPGESRKSKMWTTSMGAEG